MVLIGFALLVAAAVFGIVLGAQNRVPTDIDAFGQVYATNLAIVFAAGLVTGLVAALAIMLLRDGVVRERRMRLDAKRSRAVEEDHAAALRRFDAGTIDETAIDVRDPDHVLTF
jgi:uncharacterized membrane protein YciS (DUF1049 family)